MGGRVLQRRKYRCLVNYDVRSEVYIFYSGFIFTFRIVNEIFFNLANSLQETARER